MKTSDLQTGLEVALLVRGDAKNLERAVVETGTLLDGETWKTGSSVADFACADGSSVSVRGEQARDGTLVLVLVSAHHGGALVPLRRVLGLAAELAPGEYAAAASRVLGEALEARSASRRSGRRSTSGSTRTSSWRCSTSWRAGWGSRSGGPDWC